MRIDQAADKLLEFLPVFEDPRFVAATWPEPEIRIELGRPTMNIPYPDYHPSVYKFMDVSRSFTKRINPYKALPEDRIPGGVPFSVLGATFPVEFFRDASLKQVRRYIKLLERGERFCEGHIAGEFKEGKVVAALRRLMELRANS